MQRVAAWLGPGVKHKMNKRLLVDEQGYLLLNSRLLLIGRPPLQKSTNQMPIRHESRDYPGLEVCLEQNTNQTYIYSQSSRLPSTTNDITSSHITAISSTQFSPVLHHVHSRYRLYNTTHYQFTRSIIV